MSIGAIAGLPALGGAAGAMLAAGGSGPVAGTGQNGPAQSQLAGAQLGPGGHDPGDHLPPPPPLGGASDHPGGPPQIVVNQSTGDGATEFVIHGTGWTPGEQVSVSLGGQTSRERPACDRAGTFNYAINQDHEFVAGSMPPGTYAVVVTAPGGARALASFDVHP